MPRQARLGYTGALHHVMSRGVPRGRIFEGKKDREAFLGRPGSLLKESGTQCLAWALLPNHFHLLMRTTNWPLKVLMQRLLTRHSVYYNHRHARAGHLFQNRYKSIICEEESYLGARRGREVEATTRATLSIIRPQGPRSFGGQ
jgi:REP element-mobilizing transposase RayT